MSWIRNTALGDIYLKDSITRPRVKLERGQIGNSWWIFYRIKNRRFYSFRLWRIFSPMLIDFVRLPGRLLYIFLNYIQTSIKPPGPETMFAIRIEIYVFAVLQTTFQTKFI
jgi:hypothetical protein